MVRNLWLLDIGNTKVKVVGLVFEEAQLRISVSSELALFSCANDWLNTVTPSGGEVAFASVRSDEYDTEFMNAAEAEGLKIQRIVTEKSAMGLTNSYSRVEKMGVDRWMAMLGAQLFSQRAYVVADAGTAITVDAVDQGMHLGGWIAPGMQLAKDAVTGNTRRVTQDKQPLQSLTFGDDTETCLHLGCVAQLQGMLWQAARLMSKQAEDFSIILSGGDAELLSASDIREDFPQVLVKPNIVLYGLLRSVLTNLSLEQQKALANTISL